MRLKVRKKKNEEVCDEESRKCYLVISLFCLFMIFKIICHRSERRSRELLFLLLLFFLVAKIGGAKG